MNPEIKNYNLGSILLGENDFQTATLTLADGATVKTGAFLARGSDGKFVPVTSSNLDSTTPSALFIEEDITNSSGSAKDYSIRALISGRVKANACNIGGTAATDAQLDLIRSYGIVPVRVTEQNELDNQ